MFVMGFQTYMRSTIPPADALEVRVEGYQWAWVYNYPSLGVSVGAQESLVVPKGQSVRLTMSSRDVLHSFYVPDFRIKKDVLPNRYTMQWFQADELIVDETVHQKISGQKRDDGSELVTIEGNIEAVKQTIIDRATEEGQSLTADQIQVGVHQVFCTEYCGNDHSRMLSSVIVLEQEHFDLWVRGTTRFDPYKSSLVKLLKSASTSPTKMAAPVATTSVAMLVVLVLPGRDLLVKNDSSPTPIRLLLMPTTSVNPSSIPVQRL